LGQGEDIEKALSLGASDYIVKAYFTPTEIVKNRFDPEPAFDLPWVTHIRDPPWALTYLS
jgi:hypothetical protein